MKILYVSFFFPPYNTIGAVRSGKLVKYLLRLGHDVRVISAKNQPLTKGLPVEIPEKYIIRTQWLNINYLPEMLRGGRKNVSKQGFSGLDDKKGYKRKIGELYKSIFNVPDGQVGWYLYAVAAGKRLMGDWKPDVIYASAMPYTSLLVASALSRQFGVPWVAELRDLWAGNYYHNYGPVRRRLEIHMEKAVLSGASGIVTVSEPLAEQIKQKYDKPVAIITNGYDPEDYNSKYIFRGESGNSAESKVISYTGTIYAGKQDPTPLFVALKEKCNQSICNIQVNFYGRNLFGIKPLIQNHGLAGIVNAHPAVPYRESLSVQMSSDVLLLLLWSDPGEKGVYTGKLFEYLGAGKPILAVGPKDNIAAKLVTSYGFGRVVSNSREAFEALDDIATGKFIYPGNQEVRMKFTREKQARQLEAFLGGVVGDERR